MATIRNSSLDNLYGKGKEKILTLDNGEQYVIKNSSMPNVFGDGREQIIEKAGKKYPLKYNNTLVSIMAVLILLAVILLAIGFFSLNFTPFFPIAGILFGLAIVISVIDSIINFFK